MNTGLARSNLAGGDMLPPAANLAPGAMVLSLRGTDRTQLRRGVALWAVVALGAGITIGYFVGKAQASS